MMIKFYSVHLLLRGGKLNEMSRSSGLEAGRNKHQLWESCGGALLFHHHHHFGPHPCYNHSLNWHSKKMSSSSYIGICLRNFWEKHQTTMCNCVIHIVYHDINIFLLFQPSELLRWHGHIADHVFLHQPCVFNNIHRPRTMIEVLLNTKNFNHQEDCEYSLHLLVKYWNHFQIHPGVMGWEGPVLSGEGWTSLGKIYMLDSPIWFLPLNLWSTLIQSGHSAKIERPASAFILENTNWWLPFGLCEPPPPPLSVFFYDKPF